MEMASRLIVGLLLLGLAGCSSFLPEDTVIGPGYRPANYFRLAPVFPDSLRRVAVLPISASTQRSDPEAGRDDFQPLLLGELGKTRIFEVIPISADQLHQWAGQTSLRAEDRIPPDLLKTIHEATGCQAVLFTCLTHYQPYKPPAVGWNMKLVDCADARIWWSVDETFDAGNPTVANAARRYYKNTFESGQPLPDSQSIFNSPGRFAQYSLAAALGTLPQR